jgi:hypothetical protein
MVFCFDGQPKILDEMRIGNGIQILANYWISLHSKRLFDYQFC